MPNMSSSLEKTQSAFNTQAAMDDGLARPQWRNGDQATRRSG